MTTLKTHRLDTLQSPSRWSFVGGPFGSKLTQRDYVDEGVPVIRGGNLSGDSRFNDNGFVFVSEEKSAELVSNMAYPGDIVFTQRGTLGDVGIIPADAKYSKYVISQSQMKLSVDPTKADARYLYYYFSWDQVASELRGLASSSGVPHINLTMLRAYEVSLPVVADQRRAASALTAIDDLIENNRRRIRVLDESIRALYDSWSVEEFQQASGGAREAKSWEHVPASSVATYLNGYAFKPGDFASDGVPIIKIRELKSGVDASTPRYEGELEEKFHIRAGDLLFSWSADINVYVWGGEDGWLNQHLFVVRPKSGIPTSYLFLALARAMPEFRALSNGATMKHIKRGALDQVSLLMAPPKLREKFASAADPMIELSIKLSRRNTTLRKLRDLLLPKLLSGEIDVSRLPLPPEEPA